MRFQTLGDKPEFVSMHVRNDAGATIVKGTPVCLSLDGTEDGLAVILPSGAASQDIADLTFFGVVTDAIGSNKIGEVIKYGVVRECVVRRATRTASTDNWSASVASSAVGALLSINTVDNAFVSTVGSTTVTQASTDANTISYFNSRMPYAFLAQTLASFASTVSTASSIFSGTAFTVLAKVFVRAL